MSEEERIKTDLANYYGIVELVKKQNGKCYMELEDYSGTGYIKISEESFNSLKKDLKKE